MADHTPARTLYIVAACDALPLVLVLILDPVVRASLYPSLLLRIGFCLMTVVMYQRTRHPAWVGAYAAILFLTAAACIAGATGLLIGKPGLLSPVLLGMGVAYGTGGAAVAWAATSMARVRAGKARL
jgi:hypothetical protein